MRLDRPCPVSVFLSDDLVLSWADAKLVETGDPGLSQLFWHFLVAGAVFAFPAEHPAHHVEDAEQGHVVSARFFADGLKLLDEALVVDELVVQVVPPLVVGAKRRTPAQRRILPPRTAMPAASIREDQQGLLR